LLRSQPPLFIIQLNVNHANTGEYVKFGKNIPAPHTPAPRATSFEKNMKKRENLEPMKINWKYKGKIEVKRIK
jgi:hypothetical protein